MNICHYFVIELRSVQSARVALVVLLVMRMWCYVLGGLKCSLSRCSQGFPQSVCLWQVE